MRRSLALLSVLLLTACSAGKEQPEIAGLRVLSEDPSHEHREGPIAYDSPLPLGGPHNPRWLRCEVYDEPVPREFAVHSMEHGGVWLGYRQGVDAARLAALKELSPEAEEYVLVAPVPDLPRAIVAATWGRSVSVDDPSDPRLEEFVRTFAGGDQGGEGGVPCTSNEGALTPEQARAELGTAAATPAVSAAPTPAS